MPESGARSVGEGWWCDGDIICLSLHGCHHQNDVCIKMGSDAESHFNVSFSNCEGQLEVTRDKTVSTDHNILKRKESRSRIVPRSLCLPAKLLLKSVVVVVVDRFYIASRLIAAGLHVSLHE